MTDIDDFLRRLERESSPEMINFGGVDPGHVDWLWPGRLPAGKLVVIDGDPSTAKSTLTLDLASRVSNGHPWPDRSPCRQGKVLLLSAEDGVADTIAPRLLAAGANRDNVLGLVRVPVIDDEGNVRMALPSLPRDIPIIRDVVIREDIRLVVIDVLMAYLSGRVDSHRDQDVRGVLHELSTLAELTGATVLLIRHLNKGTGGNPLYRGGGSIGIVGAARSAYLIARDPDDRDRLIMASTKSNLAAAPSSLAFRLESVPELGCARITWESEPVEYTADRLLSGPTSDEDREDEDEAVRWLKEYLTEGDRGGSAPAREVFKAARADGIQDRRLQRARRRAGVSSARNPAFQGGAIWTLDETVSPQTVEDRTVPPIHDTTRVIHDIHDTSQSADVNGPGGVANGRPTVEDRTSWPIHDSRSPIHVSSQNGVVNDVNGVNGVVNGRDRPAEDRPACVYCGLPLPESAVLDGFDCHASCQEEP